MSVTNSVCCWPIVTFGSETLKSKVLPSIATGETIGGFGLTEPGAGSDAGSLRTTARRITNAGFARWYVVVAAPASRWGLARRRWA